METTINQKKISQNLSEIKNNIEYENTNKFEKIFKYATQKGKKVVK